MTSSFFTDVIKTIDNEYASLADDGISAGDVSSFIDTGSYIFNALLNFPDSSNTKPCFINLYGILYSQSAIYFSAR